MNRTANANVVPAGDANRSPLWLSVVMVTYNSAHVAGNAIEPISGTESIELRVIDNGSSDGTPEYIERAFPNAVLMRNGENAGFARAVNAAALGATGDYLLLLNPDAVISPVDLETMRDVMISDPNVAIIGPLMKDPADSHQVVAAGHAPTIWRMFLHGSGISRLGRIFPALEGLYLFHHNVESPRDVDWVTGGCMLIRRTVWDELGGLTTRWFMYAEDIDFCLRARRSGHRVRLEPAAVADHALGGSSRGVSGSANPAWIVNLFDLYRVQIARSPLHSHAWRVVVQMGFVTRLATYRALAIARPAHRSVYVEQASRYGVFIRALAEVDVRRP